MMGKFDGFTCWGWRNYCGDLSDFLNSTFTPLLLFLCGVVVFGMGQPIHCWFPGPANFQEEYAKTWCLNRGVFDRPRSYDETKHQINPPSPTQTSFFEWTGYLLLVSALLHLLPRILWTFFAARIDMPITTAAKSVVESKFSREVAVHTCFEDVTERIASRHYGFQFSRAVGILVYLLMKLVSIVILISQFINFNHFLDPTISSYTFSALSALRQGNVVPESHNFPRVIRCANFSVVVMGKPVSTEDFRCILPTNAALETLLTMITTWFLLLLLVTVLSLFYWAFLSLIPSFADSFLRPYVHIAQGTNKTTDGGTTWIPESGAQGHFNQSQTRIHGARAPGWGVGVSRKALRNFSRHFLQLDGVFFLRMIQSNVGEYETQELIRCLWKNYKESGLMTTVEANAYSNFPDANKGGNTSVDGYFDSKTSLNGNQQAYGSSPQTPV